jgi:hypothetical protein
MGAHVIDLSLFSEQPDRSTIRAYRTSANEDLASVQASIKTDGSTIILAMPAQSITTLVIPLRSEKVGMDNLLADGCEYLIVPRQETTRALTATNSKVTLEDTDYGKAQRWQLSEENNGTYGFKNALGLRLTAHRASNSSSLTAVKSEASEQNFYIDEVDYPYFKILASNGRSHGFDLSNASSEAGTAVSIWQYADNNTTPTHRQWMLFPLTTVTQSSAIVQQHSRATAVPQAIYSINGVRRSSVQKGLNIIRYSDGTIRKTY